MEQALLLKTLTTHKTGDPVPKNRKWRSFPWGRRSCFFFKGLFLYWHQPFADILFELEGWGNRCHGPHPFITFRNDLCNSYFFSFFKKNWKSFMDRGKMRASLQDSEGTVHCLLLWNGNKNWTQIYTTGISKDFSKWGAKGWFEMLALEHLYYGACTSINKSFYLLNIYLGQAQ